MEIIICNVLIALFSLGITNVMSNLINAFSNDEKVTFKGLFKKVKFDWKVCICTAFSLIALFYKYAISFEFLIFGFLAIILVMDAFTDIKAQIIPNELNFLGFVVGIILAYASIVFRGEAGLDMILGLLTGAGIFGLIAIFAFVVYKREGMGLGDVKLMGMLGLFFGVFNIIQIFILSFAIGAVVSIILLVTKKKKSSDYLAFGPFIVIASIITMFVPYTVLFPWYMSFLASF